MNAVLSRIFVALFLVPVLAASSASAEGTMESEGGGGKEASAFAEMGLDLKANVDLVLVQDLIGTLMVSREGDALVRQVVLDVAFVRRRGAVLLLRYTAVREDGSLIVAEAPAESGDIPLLYLDDLLQGLTFLVLPGDLELPQKEAALLDGVDEHERLVMSTGLSRHLFDGLRRDLKGSGSPPDVASSIRLTITEASWRTNRNGIVAMPELRLMSHRQLGGPITVEFLSGGSCPALIITPTCLKKDCPAPCNPPVCCCQAAGPGLECLAVMGYFCNKGDCTDPEVCTVTLVGGRRIRVYRCTCQ